LANHDDFQDIIFAKTSNINGMTVQKLLIAGSFTSQTALKIRFPHVFAENITL